VDGFAPDSVPDVRDQGERAQALLSMLVSWALDRPVVAKPHWPEGKAAASVVTVNILDEVAAEFAARKCRKEKIRATFFVQGKVALEHPELMEPLLENGEIGNTSYFEAEEESIRGQPLASQERELAREVSFLRRAGVAEVIGYRPPMEEYDENTIVAAARAGMKVFFGNVNYDRLWPVRHVVDGGGVIYQFPRVVPDAYQVVAEHGIGDPKLYRKVFAGHAERIFSFGGIFPYIFHVSFQDQEANGVAMSAFLKWLRKQPVWLTTFGEIVDWIRLRDQIDLGVPVIAACGTTVSLSNPTPAQVEAFPVVYLPSRRGTTMDRNPPAGVKVRKLKSFGYLLQVDLAPYENKSIPLW
jgi:hypothetical protein